MKYRKLRWKKYFVLPQHFFLCIKILLPASYLFPIALTQLCQDEQTSICLKWEIFSSQQKLFIILILTSTATSLLSTAQSIAMPCSVKTYGIYLLPPWALSSLEVAFCDLKHSYSSGVKRNINSEGNLFYFFWLVHLIFWL